MADPGRREIGPQLPKIPGQPERNIAQEHAAAAVAGASVEFVSHNLISQAVEPKQLFYGLREKESRWESGFVAQPLGNDFSPPSVLTTMMSRANWLGQTPDDLIHKGLLIAYDANSGMGVLRSPAKHGGLVIDNERIVQDQTPEGFPYTWVDIGLPEQRAGMAAAYHVGSVEINVRALMGDQYGILTNLNVRDDLATLVDWQHGTQATYRPEHMEALFNLPSIRELEALHEYKYKPEDIKKMRELGDQIEEAMLCELIMMKSGSKEGMQDLLARPGADHLIRKMATEEENRRKMAEDKLAEKENRQSNADNIRYTGEDWITEYIGDVDGWEDDMQRDLKKTWRQEIKDRKKGKYDKNERGRRGKLTQWANMISFKGEPGEISTKIEKHFIEKDVGGAVGGSEEAAWMATVLMRDIGAFSSWGYTALPNGQSHAELGTFRILSADDRQKFYSYMFFVQKEGYSNRSSGVQELIYRVPDMAMDLFHWGQVAVDGMFEKDETGALILDDNNEPKVAKRSIWDAWLGTAEQPKRDLVTGKIAEYGIKEVQVDLDEKGDFSLESDRDLIEKGQLVLIKDPDSKHGESAKFYVTKKDAEKIKNGEKTGAEYDAIANDEKARVFEIEDPDSHEKRRVYMTEEDRLKIQNGGAILMRETEVQFKPEVDPKTGKPKSVEKPESGKTRVFYAKKVQAEPGNRLGNLNWDSLETYWHGTFGTMQWLMGRDKVGVWTDIKNVDDFGAGDFSLSRLKMMYKYIGITQNAITLTQGSPHLFDMGKVTLDAVQTYDLTNDGGTTFSFHEVQTEGSETIQRNLFRNIIAARVHTSNWVQNIMGKKSEAYNLAKIGGPLYEDVPLSNILEMFIKEALKGTPKTEEELLAHYVDDLKRLQKPIDVEQPKKFYDETARWLKSVRSREVGVRKGRKVSSIYQYTRNNKLTTLW